MSAEASIKIHNLQFDSTNGSVKFQLQKMLGCCGVAIIGNVRFEHTPQTAVERLYEDFHKHVTTCTTPFDFRRCKLLMSDRVGGKVYEFCQHNEWMGGTEKYNRKTKRKIAVYEFDRDNKYVANF